MDRMRKKCPRCGRAAVLYDIIWDEDRKARRRFYICQCGNKLTCVEKDCDPPQRDPPVTLEGVNRRLEELLG